MTRKRVHRAFVEEGVDDEGDAYFVAGCLETFTVCDAFAFPEMDTSESAVERAVRYLGDSSLHNDGEHFCDAEHVL